MWPISLNARERGVTVELPAMDSSTRIVASPSPGTALPDEPELRAPVKVADGRRRRDWLTTAWTVTFGIYAAAVVPLIGWAIVEAL